MGHHGRTGGAVTADDVGHAGREVLGGDLGEHHRGDRGGVTGLEHTVFPAAMAGQNFQIAIIIG